MTTCNQVCKLGTSHFKALTVFDFSEVVYLCSRKAMAKTHFLFLRASTHYTDNPSMHSSNDEVTIEIINNTDYLTNLFNHLL